MSGGESEKVGRTPVKVPTKKNSIKDIFFFDVITGNKAKLVHKLLEFTMWKVTANKLANKFFGFKALKESNFECVPTEYPVMDSSHILEETSVKQEELLVEHPNWPYKTILDYRDVYINKAITPTTMIETLIELCEGEKITSLNAILETKYEILIKAAQESTKRYQEDNPLSLLDGIPFVVKENIKIKNFKHGFGFDGDEVISEETAFCIQKLLDAGALLVGTATMTTFGANTMGYSTSRTVKAIKNPWNDEYYAGGSSGGCAAVIAAGLCPFAIAAQWFGSIIIPSSFTGMVGFKPTLSRVSNTGYTLCEFENKMATIGTITNCVSDAALVYSFIAGKDEKFAHGLLQPPITLPSFKDFPLSTVRIGTCQQFNQNCDLSIIKSLNGVVDFLKEKGCTIEAVEFSELRSTSAAAHANLCRTMLEFSMKLKDSSVIRKSKDTSALVIKRAGELIDETKMRLIDYQRSKCVELMKNIFEKVDIVILPATGCKAPVIVQSHGNYGAIDGKFNKRANSSSIIPSFVGLPALTLMMGSDPETKLPISAQLIANWWKEDLLLATAHELEKDFKPTEPPKISSCPLEIKILITEEN